MQRALHSRRPTTSFPSRSFFVFSIGFWSLRFERGKSLEKDRGDPIRPKKRYTRVSGAGGGGMKGLEKAAAHEERFHARDCRALPCSFKSSIHTHPCCRKTRGKRKLTNVQAKKETLETRCSSYATYSGFRTQCKEKKKK